MAVSIKNKSKVLSSSKAIAVRKKISALNEKSGSSFKALATTKKELGELKKGIKKDLNSLNEMDEMESLRLQAAMDRLSKMMTTLSNVLKKIGDSAAVITESLK